MKKTRTDRVILWGGMAIDVTTVLSGISRIAFMIRTALRFVSTQNQPSTRGM